MTNAISRSINNTCCTTCKLKCGTLDLNSLKQRDGNFIQIVTELWPPYNRVMEQEYNFSMLFNCSYWEICDFTIIIKRAIDLIRRAVYNKLMRHNNDIKERVILYDLKGKHIPLFYIARYHNNEPFELVYWFVETDEIHSLTTHMNKVITSRLGTCIQCRINFGFISSDYIYDKVICVYGGSNFIIHHLNEKKLKYIDTFEFSCYFWKRHSTREILNCVFGSGGLNFPNANLMIDMF